MPPLRYLEAAPAPGVRARGTLVLIHAFPLNARLWEPQLRLAEGGWQVLAPQLRGMDGGTSDAPATSIDDYAGDVIDLLDGLHVGDAVIGGLSLGGYVALAMFRHAPRYLRGLVLADTRSQADTAEGVEGRKRMLALLEKEGVAGVVAQMTPNLLGETTKSTRPDLVERVHALAMANPPEAVRGAIMALMTRQDSTPLLASIHCPTLILVGDQDRLTPPALSVDMQRAIPGSELALIEGAGHLSSLEQPEAFNAALARFLEHRV